MEEVKLPSNWGDWKIVQYVGSGSYGTVYKAERSLGDKKFYSAIKIVQIPETDNEVEMMRKRHSSEESLRLYYQDIVKSCVDEIKMMDILKGCSHIVSIEDYYVEENQEDIQWTLYIRMEFLQCFTDYIQTHEISEREAIKLGLDICEALETCEKVKIIHRDIKPDNIFVSPLGYVKLGDFGVARQLEKTKAAYSIKGTQVYMAPEVLRGAPYGKDTDIYALGLVLYELVNKGRAPFLDLTKKVIYSRDKEEALFRRMSGEALPKPVEASDEFSAIILKACAYEPSKRYQSASDMKNDLQALIQPGKKKSAKKSGLFLLIIIIMIGLGVGGKFIWKQIETKKQDLTVKQEIESEEPEKIKAGEASESQKIEEELTSEPESVEEDESPEPIKVEAETTPEPEKMKTEMVVDIGDCADFIIYSTKNGGNVEKFLFQKKLKTALENEEINAGIAKKIMEEISIQDFVMDYEKQIPEGTSVTMTFHGAEKIKEKYDVTLVFRSVTKEYK